MKFNSLQATPRRKRQQCDALIPIPKTFAVNQLLINNTFQDFKPNKSKCYNSQLRSTMYAENSVFSSTSSYSQSQYEPKQEPFYIDTIQKVKKALSHKQNLEDELKSELSPLRQAESNESKLYNININENVNLAKRKKLMKISTGNEDALAFFQPNKTMSLTSRQKNKNFQKPFEEPQTSRYRNTTVFSQIDQHNAGSLTNRKKSDSFSKHIDSFSILEKQMNIQQNNSFNQNKLNNEQQNTQINYNADNQIKQNISEQLNSYRNTLALADKQDHRQYYEPEISNPQTVKRANKSSSGKREKYHSNTFFRLEEEKALQFENSQDIIDMAEVAMKNLSHQQVLQKRKKLYEPDILDDDENNKQIKCNFIQKTNLIHQLEEPELNHHIKERIDALQNIENYRYQKKYGLVEILKEADQIKNERIVTKQKIYMSNYPSQGLQEAPFRKNSYIKHSRELSEFHIDNVHNRLYEKNQQLNGNQNSSKNKEQTENICNKKISNSFDTNNNSVGDVKQNQHTREIKDYQKILRDMKKQGEYYTKVSELLNTIYFSTPEDSFKEEELKLFRRHQQAIFEEIQSKKKK
ncbi:hypothetical protein TTHERM_00492810 (macronuclear) [Tetrahymena thermophila SB210]|uniref:Uncharacterized protein n=1 Tax=Tetrahymena thermophila (strain SB210) TaxID=312017 RepID=I7MHF4_TETTS|nr:hypothetical protein TTHERM_00492810 [Tetrahymena thermophila SB210]EAS02928.1 hypothetical protein TTHERM_00492810 [Tetrahymena thermophila SB210]|eukprot:XP_001023173.1 hypothetical protein TTHERM_00492810 [Tetrahymena thermophila SB210]